MPQLIRRRSLFHTHVNVEIPVAVGRHLLPSLTESGDQHGPSDTASQNEPEDVGQVASEHSSWHRRVRARLSKDPAHEKDFVGGAITPVLLNDDAVCAGSPARMRLPANRPVQGFP
jgi:hypothetical protein